MKCLTCGAWYDRDRARALGAPFGFCSPACHRKHVTSEADKFAAWWQANCLEHVPGVCGACVRCGAETAR